MTIKEQIIEQIDRLNEDKDEQRLREILAFVAAPNRLRGEPGWRAIQHAREIGFSHEDLAEMEAAIEEACEIIEDFPEINLDD